MIAVDTSIVVAILENEDDADIYIQKLEDTAAPIMSAATFVELGAVMKNRRGEAAFAIVDQFMKDAEITIEPLTAAQAHIAREAYTQYGALNFGDAFSYALAKEKNIPLLFKGDDFSKTDLKSA